MLDLNFRPDFMDVDDIDLSRRSLGTAKSQLDIKDVHVAVEVGRVSGRRVNRCFNFPLPLFSRDVSNQRLQFQFVKFHQAKVKNDKLKY